MNKYKKIRLSDTVTKDEHILVWIEHNGIIPEGMVIHHIDRDKSNNDINNLIMLSRAEHASLHNKGSKRLYLRVDAICGTTSSYRRGCRCSLCKEHHRQRIANYRNRIKIMEFIDEQARSTSERRQVAKG